MASRLFSCGCPTSRTKDSDFRPAMTLGPEKQKRAAHWSPLSRGTPHLLAENPWKTPNQLDSSGLFAALFSLHTGGVTGSIPVAPTTNPRKSWSFRDRQSRGMGTFRNLAEEQKWIAQQIRAIAILRRRHVSQIGKPLTFGQVSSPPLVCGAPTAGSLLGTNE
jgi:hypothetical protein